MEVCDRGALAGALGTQDLGTTVLAGDEGLVEQGLPGGVRVLALDLRAEYLVVGQESLIESAENGAKSRQHRGREHSTTDGSPETVKPIYVRAPDADLHITKMKDPWADRRGRR